MAWSRVVIQTAFAVLCLSFPAAAQQATTRVDFGRDVQPILRDRCYGCLLYTSPSPRDS